MQCLQAAGLGKLNRGRLAGGRSGEAQERRALYHLRTSQKHVFVGCHVLRCLRRLCHCQWTLHCHLRGRQGSRSRLTQSFRPGRSSTRDACNQTCAHTVLSCIRAAALAACLQGPAHLLAEACWLPRSLLFVCLDWQSCAPTAAALLVVRWSTMVRCHVPTALLRPLSKSSWGRISLLQCSQDVGHLTCSCNDWASA